MILFLTALFVCPVQADETQIVNIRHWAAPDHTRIVIDATENPTYEMEKEAQKLTLTIDEATASRTLKRILRLKKPGIDRIVVTPLPEESQVRVELFLTEHTETKVFKLQRIEEKPFRIVVDIILPDVEKKETEERSRAKVSLKKKIVVIDPGHGGDDPGAVGKMGTYEKNVVLALSRKIRDTLNKKDGYRAFLTRDGDYYVAFKKRLKIAREYQADLFMSIHADAEKTRTAAGTSVYALSLKSASSEAARILARNENLADIVGGVANGEVIKEESDPIILSMVQNNTMNVSKTLGSTLLRNIGAIHRIKFTAVQEAPFMVLKLPEIPSVLIETAYISNPRDEKLLRSPKFQKELAETIARSAVDFLEHTPGSTSPAILVKKNDTPKAGDPKADAGKAEPKKTEEPKAEKPQADQEKAKSPAVDSPDDDAKPVAKKTRTVIYTVKPGNSLDRIARRYGVTVDAIVEANDLKANAALYVNRKLKIPVPVAEETPAKTEKAGSQGASAKSTAAKKTAKPAPFVLYKVKSGETLDTIAKKNGTTLAVLLKMNDMKMTSPLLAGKKIKVPAAAVEEASEEAAAETKKETPAKKKGAVEKAAKTPAKEAVASYTVKKGETLEIIAKKNGTTIAALLKLNNMKAKAPLLAGKKIKVPAAAVKEESEEAAPQTSKETPVRKKEAVEKAAKTPAKETVAYHTVKKGETLEIIARKNGTTIPALQKLNNMKAKSPLLAGKKIKVPAAAEDVAEETTLETKKAATAKKKEPAEKTATTPEEIEKAIDARKDGGVEPKGKADAAKKSGEAEPKGKAIVYVVKKNDTLDGIAKKNKVPLQTLMKINGIEKGESLQAGRKIKLGARNGSSSVATKVYVVKKGETLDIIARRHKTTIAALQELNGSKKLTPLLADQRLKVPVRKAQ